MPERPQSVRYAFAIRAMGYAAFSKVVEKVLSVFATAWAHAVGHTLIFLLAGMAGLLVFPALQANPRLYFG